MPPSQGGFGHTPHTHYKQPPRNQPNAPHCQPIFTPRPLEQSHGEEFHQGAPSVFGTPPTNLAPGPPFLTP